MDLRSSPLHYHQVGKWGEPDFCPVIAFKILAASSQSPSRRVAREIGKFTLKYNEIKISILILVLKTSNISEAVKTHKII